MHNTARYAPERLLFHFPNFWVVHWRCGRTSKGFAAPSPKDRRNKTMLFPLETSISAALISNPTISRITNWRTVLPHCRFPLFADMSVLFLMWEVKKQHLKEFLSFYSLDNTFLSAINLHTRRCLFFIYLMNFFKGNTYIKRIIVSLFPQCWSIWKFK